MKRDRVTFDLFGQDEAATHRQHAAQQRERAAAIREVDPVQAYRLEVAAAINEGQAQAEEDRERLARGERVAL